MQCHCPIVTAAGEPMLLCTQEETPGIGIGTERSTAEEFLGTAGIVMAAEWKGSAASGAGTPL